jgi:hypothetical protein
MRCHATKQIYPNHRLPPWSTEDETHDRSNRLLDRAFAISANLNSKHFFSLHDSVEQRCSSSGNRDSSRALRDNNWAIACNGIQDVAGFYVLARVIINHPRRVALLYLCYHQFKSAGMTGTVNVTLGNCDFFVS